MQLCLAWIEVLVKILNKTITKATPKVLINASPKILVEVLIKTIKKVLAKVQVEKPEETLAIAVLIALIIVIVTSKIVTPI